MIKKIIINYLFNVNYLFLYKLNIFLIYFFIFLTIYLFYTIFIFLIIYKNKFKNLKIKNKNKKFELYLFVFFIFLIIILSIFNTFSYNSKNFKKILLIKIISYQWKWHIIYLNNFSRNLSYFININEDLFKILNNVKKNKSYINKVDNNIILPIKKNIKIILTSNDVIHSIFLKNLNIKKDIFLNYIRDFNIFNKKLIKINGYCTELCGKNHSFMPINLKFVNYTNYKKWIISKKFLNFFIFNF